VLPFHRHLARTGLEVLEPFGFVLAGGYAVSANGMGDRMSQDVDLFTNRQDAGDFARAASALRDAYERDGLRVEVTRAGLTFLDLAILDPRTGETSSVQLGLDYRAHEPAHLAIGPVLDAQDAVANKTTALYSRGETRDFIDVDVAVRSGRFTRGQVLALGDDREVEPMDRAILTARFREIAGHSPEDFSLYGVSGAERERIVARFAAWADEIDPRLSAQARDAAVE
jgi:hypothetical protein